MKIEKTKLKGQLTKDIGATIIAFSIITAIILVITGILSTDENLTTTLFSTTPKILLLGVIIGVIILILGLVTTNNEIAVLLEKRKFEKRIFK